MTLTIKHVKTNNETDLTQAQLNAIIAGGASPLPPAGTLLADITLPSDWNAALTYTGVLEPAAGGTGVNNGTNTLTLNSSVTLSGTNTGDQTTSNSDGTITVATGSTNPVISLNLANANTWTALQTFGTNISIGGVTATGATGTGNVAFSASPTFTGTLTAGALTLSNTATLQNVNVFGKISSSAASASTAAFTTTVSPFVGTGTTSFPQWFAQGTGVTAATNWNSTTNGGTVFGANQTTGFVGNFADFKINGGATSSFTMNSGGGMFSNAAVVTSAGSAGTNGPTLSMVFAGYGLGVNNNGELVSLVNSTALARLGAGCTISSNGAFQWSNTTNVGLSNAPDTFLTRRSAANINLGAADAAAPVAQTISTQSVVAGTSNTAGVNTTIALSQGTGTGAGGSLVIKGAVAGTTGTAQNALVNAFVLSPAGLATTYNSIATTGQGVPAIYGYARVAAQAAAATFSTYTVGASDGTFLVSANVLITASTLHNFTVTCSYIDEGNTPRVVTLQFSNLAGTFVTAIANAAGTVPYEGVPLHIRCKASTAITIASAAGGTYTTVTYNGESSITQIA